MYTHVCARVYTHIDSDPGSVRCVQTSIQMSVALSVQMPMHTSMYMYTDIPIDMYTGMNYQVIR